MSSHGGKSSSGLRDASGYADYVEAWMAGFIAARDGLTDADPEALLAACGEAWRMSGGELARRANEGTLSDQDRAKIAALPRL